MATTFNQLNYRGRNDDGSQTTATWKAAVNTGWQQATGVTFRVRFDISESGTTAATLAGQLQSAKNGGSFQAVNASSTIVKSVAGANVTDGTATTQQIGSGTFTAGTVEASDGLCATTASMSSGTHTELEYTVQINAADVGAGDTVQLRVVRSTSTAFTGTYTSPSINLAVTKSPAAASATFTGQAASLKKTLAPAATSATFTGATPTLSMGKRLSPASASATFTGQAASLKKTLAPAATSASFSGRPASLKLSLAPATTSATFTGQGASLKKTVRPAAAAATFTGQSAALKKTLSPGSASASFTGQAATLALTLHPPATSATFTAQTPVLILTGSGLTPEAASAVFTGGTPSLHLTLRPAAAAALFTGGFPLVTVARFAPPSIFRDSTAHGPRVFQEPTFAVSTVRFWDEIAGVWDDIPGNWDDAGSAGGGAPVSSVFRSAAALAPNLFRERASSAPIIFREPLDSVELTWDQIPGNFDDRPENFDDAGGSSSTTRRPSLFRRYS